MSLEFATWRIAFATFLPIGILAVVSSFGLIRGPQAESELEERRDSGPIDFIGAGLIVACASVLILSTNHLHPGEESFTSPDALTYHLPMQGAFFVLLGVFALVEHKVSNPMVDFRHFQHKYFTMSLVSNVAFHFSMLAAMTLVPILMEEGFGLSPIFVTFVLIPNQSVGLVMPMIAGWLYDKHGSRLFRPLAMMTIASGFLALGLLAPNISWWIVPFLMLPITMGTAIFNPINNATVMSALPLEHRGVASGLLETTRELGHAIGATASATALVDVHTGVRERSDAGGGSGALFRGVPGVDDDGDGGAAGGGGDSVLPQGEAEGWGGGVGSRTVAPSASPTS